MRYAALALLFGNRCKEVVNIVSYEGKTPMIEIGPNLAHTITAIIGCASICATVAFCLWLFTKE
jgi:hypothetical protein